MKITVKTMDVEVEGEAAEIAEALPSVLGLTPAPPTNLLPAAPSEVRELESAPCDDTDVVLPHERAAKADPDDVWVPVGGERSPMPMQRFERWEDVPIDRRVWGSGCRTCHVLRDPQDPYSTFCGHDVGQAYSGRRIAADAKVCGSCNRQVEIGARP